MTNTFIYVGDSLLDLDPETLVTINIQSINVGDLKSRNVSYTNQFKVKANENNSRIFGYVQSEWSRSATPYQFNECKIVQNGIETLPEAICIVTKYEKGYFVLNIFEQLFDIFQFLEGKKIKDIDPIPDSIWDVVEMDNNRDNTSGIISAALQWGHGSIYDSDFFLPCFYYHTFIREILTTTGLTLSGAILTEPDFTDLVIPFPGDSFNYSGLLVVPEFVAKGTKAEGSGASVAPTYMGSIVAGNILFIQVLNVQVTPGSVSTVSGYTSISEETFSWGTAKLMYKIASGSESGTETVSRSGSSGGGGDFMMAQIYQYESPSLTYEAGVGNKATSNTTITWSAVTVGGSSRSLAAFVVDYDGSGVTGPTGYATSASDNTTGISGGTMAVYTKENTSSGASVTGSGSTNGWASWHISMYGTNPFNVDWNSLWPDIDVKDILRDFFTRFGIIARQKNNVIYLKTIEEILTDRAGSLNWTSKLTKTDKPIDFKNSYAQDNYFDYNNQENNPDLGRGIMTIANETLDPIDTIFSSVFDTVETAELDGDYNSAVMDVYDTESTDITDFKNSPPFTVLTLRDPGTDPDITFFVTPRSDYKVAYFVDAGEAKDSGFQYFVDEYYNKYSFALQKSKIIVKEYMLTESDIYNYNSHKMIYDGEGYYLVNKIRNFVPDKITTVELFKVM